MRSRSPSCRSSSSSLDAEAAAALLRRCLDDRLGAIQTAEAAPTANTVATPNAVDEENDQCYAFRLFGPSAHETSSVAHSIQRIRLDTPSAHANRPAGFVQPARPLSYYFTAADDAVAQRRRSEEYACVSVSGSEVRARAVASKWYGCVCRWKVQVLDPVGRKVDRVMARHAGEADTDVAHRGDRRTRKGKKARVALRRKRALELQRKQASERTAMAKEEAGRAKRTEKNRRQKLKRREKERAKKAAGSDDGGGGDLSVGDGQC